MTWGGGNCGRRVPNDGACMWEMQPYGGFMSRCQFYENHLLNRASLLFDSHKVCEPLLFPETLETYCSLFHERGTFSFLGFSKWIQNWMVWIEMEERHRKCRQSYWLLGLALEMRANKTGNFYKRRKILKLLWRVCWPWSCYYSKIIKGEYE